MVGVAQLVRALGCGSSCRGFESHHPPKDNARVAELVDALVLGTSTFGVRVRVSPLVIKLMKIDIKIAVLIVFLISGCNNPQELKILSMDDKKTCISETKEECINTIKNKCNKNIKIFREELVEYVFSSDKYITTFSCE